MPTGQGKEIINTETHHKILPSILICISVILLDQLSKILVVKKLYLGQSVGVIDDIFHITLVYNTGTAFGMFKDMTLFFVFLTLFVILFIVYNIFFNSKDRTKIEMTSLYFILAGAIGNLIDRIRIGSVIDFLDFRIWPVFNIADSAITCGAILLAISLFRKEKSSRRHVTTSPV